MKKLNQKLRTFVCMSGVNILLVSAALFFAGCNNVADNAKAKIKGIEEFAVNFEVEESSGGKLTAKIDGGKSINSGEKVQKDKTVVFTAVADSNKEVESWTLNGEVVNGNATEYRLKVTKTANVKIKFKDKVSEQPKKIQISNIKLGYPDLSDKDGKTVEGSILNSNTTIPDFEVPDSKFPVIILHKTEFTVEHAFITFNGGTREEVHTGIGGKGLITKEFTLIENKKIPFVIEITADKYEPIKLSFNVTYKKPVLKSFDNVTHIKFTTNSSGSKSVMYGSLGEKKLSSLTDGNELIDVSTATPKLTVTIVKSEGQPKAAMKLNNTSFAGDFSAGSSNLEIDLTELNKGENPFEITLSKPGYETKTYKLKLNYKPLLSLKELKVNGNVFNRPFPEPIMLEPTDPNPVTIEAEANDAGVDVSFKKQKSASKWETVVSPIQIKSGETVKMKIYLKKDGYTTTTFSFSIKRKEKINLTKVTVDGTAVEDGASHSLEKDEAKADIAVHLAKAYSGITFKINDELKTPEMNEDKTIATFKAFPLNANSSKTIVIKAEAEGFAVAERTITVNHTTPVQNAIEITKITVDGEPVAAGTSHNIEKASASATIEVYLKQAYAGISFKINDELKTPEMDTDNTIATFRDLPLNANTENIIKIAAEAAGFTKVEQTITIKHTAPAAGETAYIIEATVTPYDYDYGEFGWAEALSKDGTNWKLSLSSGGPHQFMVKVNPNGKDISDITKFTIYMKNKTNDKVYADGKTGKNNSGDVVFEFYHDMQGQEINIPTGKNEIEVKILYENTVVESCVFVITR